MRNCASEARAFRAPRNDTEFDLLDCRSKHDVPFSQHVVPE